MEINGIAHVILTAGNFERSTRFYRELLPFLGMKIVMDGDMFLYGIGARTAIGIRPPDDKFQNGRFVQTSVGLHHLCFRSKDRESIDELFIWLKDRDAKIVHAPEDGSWAPGYYSVLFEDPDGIRLEVNHVPGKGLLDTGGKLDHY